MNCIYLFSTTRLTQTLLSLWVDTDCVCCTWYIESSPGLGGYTRITAHNNDILCLHLRRLAFPILRSRQILHDQCSLPQNFGDDFVGFESLSCFGKLWCLWCRAFPASFVLRAWKDWRKPRKPSFSLIGVLAKIPTEHLLNASRERYGLNGHLARYNCKYGANSATFPSGVGQGIAGFGVPIAVVMKSSIF
jgi:hypothetical protein